MESEAQLEGAFGTCSELGTFDERFQFALLLQIPSDVDYFRLWILERLWNVDCRL